MGAQQDLFGSEPEPGRRADAPVASRLRPLSFDDRVGQEKAVAVLRSRAESGRLPRVVLWGPPGSGETALPAILARATWPRVVLNALEAAAALAGGRAIALPDVEAAMQQRHLLYDRAGDQHYDMVSAMIKSIRGSDPDAAVYWMARMLEAGEDPMFVARRLVISAAEDVGLAEPGALAVAVAAQQAAHFVGMPEAVIPLSEAAVHLAKAPKSNASYMAYNRAREAIERTGNLPVPLHLRQAPTGLMKAMGYGKGYKYAHDYEGAKVDQQHLPDELKDARFYEP